MIIIKTKTGDIFVNDREMVNITHNRELHTVEIHDVRAMGICSPWIKPPIKQVESVVYINEQTGQEWKDDGSELEYLRKKTDALKLEVEWRTEIVKRSRERLRKLGHECVQWVQYYHDNMPKDLCEQMRNRGEEEKAYVNDGEDWNFRCEWMQNHQKPEEIEADEVARLNTIIEAQAARIRELKAETERLEANERMRQAATDHGDEPAPPRRPWWRRWLNI